MTELKAQVLDESTGQVLSGAQVYASGPDGNPTGVARGDLSGVISTMVPDGQSVLVTVPGYAPKTVDVGEANDSGIIQLTPAPLAAGLATQQIKNTTLSGVPWWVWVAAAGGAVYLASMPDKKKISGDKGAGYIIPIGVVVLAYLLLNGLDLFGPSAASQNATGIDTSTAEGVDNSLAAAQAAGTVQTISDSQAAGIADAIWQAGLQHDPYTVKRQIIQANTLTDLLKIIKAFGVKKADVSSWSPCGALGIFCQSYNLSAWLRLPFMDSNTLADINNYLSATGINYQF
jgi:hypothetical protein